MVRKRSRGDGQVSGEIMPRRRRVGEGWETWLAGLEWGEGDFDAEARRRGGRRGGAAGKSRPESAEPAEFPGLRSEEHATGEGWREPFGREPATCGWVSGELMPRRVRGGEGGETWEDMPPGKGALQA